MHRGCTRHRGICLYPRVVYRRRIEHVYSAARLRSRRKFSVRWYVSVIFVKRIKIRFHTFLFFVVVFIFILVSLDIRIFRRYFHRTVRSGGFSGVGVVSLALLFQVRSFECEVDDGVLSSYMRRTYRYSMFLNEAPVQARSHDDETHCCIESGARAYTRAIMWLIANRTESSIVRIYAFIVVIVLKPRDCVAKTHRR